jgi:pimeloyl-ACP methyl ester carboxylesterase
MEGGGMRDINLTFPSDDGLPIAGTLTLPEGAGPHPAVLLLYGSGRADRDSNAGRLRLNLGGPLASALAAEGIATLRYDRRGVGDTPGDWHATGFTDNRDDAAAALRWLAARPDIRADAIGVIGHSEGAIHAMSLAARSGVAAAVLLAAVARPGENALRWQGSMISRDLPAQLLPLIKRLAEWQLARIKATSTDVARVAGIPLNARWMREMLIHDPRPDLRAITVPVLAITGSKDIQVDPADLAVIRRMVPGAVETHEVQDLTHMLRRDPGRPSVRSYRRLLSAPVDADLVAEVTRWLARQLTVPSSHLTSRRPSGPASPASAFCSADQSAPSMPRASRM